MFGVGMSELLVIFVIALLVFGPKKLPELARSLGQALAYFKRASDDFRETIQAEMDTLEEEERRKALGPTAEAAPSPEAPPLAPDSPGEAEAGASAPPPAGEERPAQTAPQPGRGGMAVAESGMPALPEGAGVSALGADASACAGVRETPEPSAQPPAPGPARTSAPGHPSPDTLQAPALAEAQLDPTARAAGPAPSEPGEPARG